LNPTLRPAYARAALLAALLGAAPVSAQTSSSDGSQTQLWAELVAGKRHGHRWYTQIDLEPRWQVTGDTWRSLELTPHVEFYPTDWVDLDAEVLVGNTLQRDGLDTFELTPRVGARFHLLSRLAPYRPDIGGLEERLPLTRLGVSTLVRLEWRNLFYSDDTPDKHQWRARLRLEGWLALNRAKLSAEKTLYAVGAGEYFVPLGDDVPERYVNKFRAGLGLGFRFSGRTKIELLYVRDWNRSSPGAASAEDVQALDARVKLLF
jgi:hypothetical protein